jgi:hypothetical protein
VGALRICDHCGDPRNPVTANNGGVIITQVGGQKRTLAYVHKSCREAWAQKHGGTTFDAITWPGLEKTVHCPKCGKAFEVVGNQDSEKKMRAEAVSCPYDSCGEPTEVMWPKHQPFFVRKVPSEM